MKIQRSLGDVAPEFGFLVQSTGSTEEHTVSEAERCTTIIAASTITIPRA
jgi:hypothetical protein